MRTSAARTRFAVPSIPNATIGRDGAARPARRQRVRPDARRRRSGLGEDGSAHAVGRRLDGPVAWLSCDVDDADASWFWRDVIAAIRHAWTDIALGDGELTDARVRHGTSPIEIANELAAQDRPGVIIIDDFHLAAPEPAAMVAFVDALPPSVRLVLGTPARSVVPARSHPGAGSTAGAAAGGPAVHQRRDRPVDGQSRHRARHRRSRAPRALDRGLGGRRAPRRACRSMPGATPDQLMRRLVETDRSLIDFLMSEVIDLQTPDDAAVPRRQRPSSASSTPSCCDAVLERTDSRDVLAAIGPPTCSWSASTVTGRGTAITTSSASSCAPACATVDPQRIPVIHRSAADSVRRAAATS